jgi:hypothetical protein
VNVTDPPRPVWEGSAAKPVIVMAGSTVSATLELAWEPGLSWTVPRMENVPFFVGTHFNVETLALTQPLGRPDQAYVKGAVPSEIVIEKLSEWPTSTSDGTAVKLVIWTSGFTTNVICPDHDKHRPTQIAVAVAFTMNVPVAVGVHGKVPVFKLEQPVGSPTYE